LNNLFGSLNEQSISLNKRDLYDIEEYKIESIFTQSSFTKAKGLLDDISSNAHGMENVILRYLKRHVKRIKPLYHYPTDTRFIIGTTNIIVFICEIINLIIMNKTFYREEDVKNFITMAANQIIKHGAEFIPNWKTLNNPIRAL
jgi:hypothetical protein